MPKDQKRILILGAGISGLYAAYLLRKDFKVTVIEARNRIGGRIHTKVIDAQENLTVEMGAEWVGDTHIRIKTLCKEFGVSLYNHALETSLIHNHTYFPPNKWSFGKSWESKLKQLLKQLPKYNEEQINRLEGIDLWHYLITNHVAKRDIELIDLLESLDYGESIHYVPALEALYSSLDKHTKKSTDFYGIKGGTDRLPKAIAKKIGLQNIHLSQKIKSVIQTAQGTKVICEGGRSFDADIVVCTLPGYSMNLVDWRPKLSLAKQKAFDQLMYSRVNKTHVLFNKRFWKNESFEVLTDLLPHEIYHATQNQPGIKGVLTSYSTGDKAHVFSNLTDQQKYDEMLKVLSLPFKKISAQPLKIFSYYWGDDPYTGGAYALYEKYQSTEFKTSLKEPHNFIFFAGEHLATDHQGFMEGAIESAEEVVKQIQQL